MTEENEIIDSPGFIRQRRNIILASLVLAFAQGTHLTIHEFNFFGTKAGIDSSVSTVPYLWVLWGYFLWRYWQAFWRVSRESTLTRYHNVKKTYLERLAAKRGLASDRNIIKIWMPHDREEPTEQGAKVVLVANLAEQTGTGAPSQKNIEVDLTHSDLLRIRARSILHLVVTSDEFSEYYVPFGIAALPLLILIWQICQR
jgi:hypothetical protein